MKLTTFALFTGFGLAIACGDDDANVDGNTATTDEDDGPSESDASSDTADQDAGDDMPVEAGTDTKATTFKVTISNVSEPKDYLSTGVFNTPDGADKPGPIAPGDAYEFDFIAGKGHSLSFATMFVQSNDWFLAPTSEEGIALFDKEGKALSGDITDLLSVWDAGTEADEEPGAGANQAPRQGEAGAGEPDPNDKVRPAKDEFENLPKVEELVKVTLSVEDAQQFTLRIENVTTAETLSTEAGDKFAVPFAPGIWAVHGGGAQLFESDKKAPDGLKELAEDGNAAVMAEDVGERTGLVTPFSPGIWAVHSSAVKLFDNEEADFGQGLVAIAEDGNPGELNAALDDVDDVFSHGVFNTPEGAKDPAPIFPDDSYSFEIEGREGDFLSFATMFIQSNDLFFGFDAQGLDLFAKGEPISGDMTLYLSLWDAGSEVNEYPGAGPNQAPRQSGPDTGPNEKDGLVAVVDDSFEYPSTASIIRVDVDPVK